MGEKNLFLCGFMGAGKTTVGKALAKRLGKFFFDTDEVIVDMLGMPIKDIFQKYGEQYFRKNETQVIREICKKNKSVVSLGGGSLDSFKNVEAIKRSGCIIFLDVDFDTMLTRLKSDSSRPLFHNKSVIELRQLYEKRKLVYLRSADMVVNANNGPIVTCDRIINNVNVPPS